MIIDLDKLEEQWPMGWAKTQPTPDQDLGATNAFIDNTAGLFGKPEAPAPAPAKLDFAPAQDLFARDQQRIKDITAAPDPLAQQEQRRANLDKAIQGYTDLALKAPKPEDASWATRRAERIAQVGEQLGHLPEGGAEQRIQQLYDRIDTGHAERVLKQNPADLQNLLADATMFSGLSPENRATLMARAAARVEHAPLDEAHRNERATVADQATRAFARAQRTVELANAAPGDIAEAAAKGEITQAQRTRLQTRARDELRVQRDETRAIARFADLRVRGYDNADPDHRAMAETYAARAVKQWGRLPPPQFAAQIGGFIADTGAVTPSINRAINVAFSRGSPAYQAETSDALMRFKDRPEVTDQVEALPLIQAVANQALRQNGASPDEAATKSFEVLRGNGEGFQGAADRRAVTRAIDAVYRTLPEDAQKQLREALPAPMPNAPLGPINWERVLGPKGPIEMNPVHRPRPGDGPMLVNPTARPPAPVRDPQSAFQLAQNQDRPPSFRANIEPNTDPSAGPVPGPVVPDASPRMAVGDTEQRQRQQERLTEEQRQARQQRIARIREGRDDDYAQTQRDLDRLRAGGVGPEGIEPDQNGVVRIGPYEFDRETAALLHRVLTASPEELRDIHRRVQNRDIVLPDLAREQVLRLTARQIRGEPATDPTNPRLERIETDVLLQTLDRDIGTIHQTAMDVLRQELGVAMQRGSAVVGGMVGGRRIGQPSSGTRQEPETTPPQAQPPAVQGTPQPPGPPSQGTPPAQPTPPQPTTPNAARPTVVEPAPNQAPNTNPTPATPTPPGAPSNPLTASPTVPEASNPQTGRRILRLSPENEARARAHIENAQREQDASSRPEPTWRVPGVPDHLQPQARALLVPNQAPREVNLSPEDHRFLFTYIDRNHPRRSATQAQRDALIPRATGFEFRVPEVETPLRMVPERVLHAWYRHHPRYWDGSTGERAQSFFPVTFSFSEMRRVINEAVSQDNEFFRQQMNSPYSAREFTVNGVRYTIGVEHGEVTRFSPIREIRTPRRSQ